MSPSIELRVPRQRRALRTRAAILEAARQEFSERGYATATSKTIAARAGVSVGSLYQYFEDKDHVLREIAAARVERIASRTVSSLAEDVGDAPSDGLPERVREALRTVVEIVLEQHREDTGLHAVLTERRHADLKLEEITASFERGLIEAGEALLRSWGYSGDCLATSFILFSMVEGAVHTHVLGQPLVSDDRLFSSLLDALVRVALPTLKGT